MGKQFLKLDDAGRGLFFEGCASSEQVAYLIGGEKDKDLTQYSEDCEWFPVPTTSKKRGRDDNGGGSSGGSSSSKKSKSSTSSSTTRKRGRRN